MRIELCFKEEGEGEMLKNKMQYFLEHFWNGLRDGYGEEITSDKKILTNIQMLLEIIFLQANRKNKVHPRGSSKNVFF